MEFTAQQIIFDRIKNHPLVLAKFGVIAKEGANPFWERNPLDIN